jgi:hypothetical protein
VRGINSVIFFLLAHIFVEISVLAIFSVRPCSQGSRECRWHPCHTSVLSPRAMVVQYRASDLLCKVQNLFSGWAQPAFESIVEVLPEYVLEVPSGNPAGEAHMVWEPSRAALAALICPNTRNARDNHPCSVGERPRVWDSTKLEDSSGEAERICGVCPVKSTPMLAVTR